MLVAPWSFLRRIVPIFLLTQAAWAQKWGYTVLLGGQGNDRAQAVATDASGIAYVAGDTTSPDLPVTPGVYQPICGTDALCNGGRDIFIARLSADGSKFLTVTYLGGSGIETVTAIVPGLGGSIFVAGTTTSTDFPWTDGPFGPCTDSQCTFLAKFDSTGTRLEFAIALPRITSISSIAVGSDSNIWITGVSNTGLVPKGPQIKGQLAGPFIVKLTPDARDILLATYALTYGDTIIHLRPDNIGSVYACGTVSGSISPATSDAFQKNRIGPSDAVVMQLDSDSGSLRYATLWGGDGSDQLLDCEVDQAGHLTVAVSDLGLAQIASLDIKGRQVAYQRDFTVTTPFGAVSSDGTVWLLTSEATPTVYVVRPFGNLDILGVIGDSTYRCCARQVLAAAPDGSLMFADLGYYDYVHGGSPDAAQQWRAAAQDAYIERIGLTFPTPQVFPTSVKFTSFAAWEQPTFIVLPPVGGPTDFTAMFKVWSDQPWINVPTRLGVRAFTTPYTSGFQAEIGRDSPDGLAHGSIFIQREGSSDPPVQIPVEFNRVDPSAGRSWDNSAVSLVYTLGDAYQSELVASTTATFTSNVGWLGIQKVGDRSTVTLEPAGLSPGMYHGILTTIDAGITTKVNYTLKVRTPEVWMTPSVFAFYRPGASMDSLTGEIGLDPQWPSSGTYLRPSGLSVSAVESSEGWLHVDKAPTALPGRVSYSIHPRSLAPGRYAATITVRCPGTSWSANVTLLVADNVPFTVSPVSITYQVPSDDLLSPRQIRVETPQPQPFYMSIDISAQMLVPSFQPVAGNTLPASAMSISGISPGAVNLYADANHNSFTNDPINLRVKMNGSAFAIPLSYVHGSNSIKATAITNAASYDANAISPGALVSIFGSQMSPREWKAVQFPTNPLNKWVTVVFSVGGVDRVASIVYESPGQLNVQVPPDLPLGLGQVKIIGPTQPYNTSTPDAALPIAVRWAFPGLFTYGDNRAVVQNPNGKLNTPSERARPGDVVVAYFTGQGPVDYRLAAGDPAPMDRILRVISSSGATVGGLQSDILFAGLTPGFVGLAQANIRIPTLSPGDYSLQIEIDGVKSNGGIISIGP